MNEAVLRTRKNLAALRTGRASIGMLASIKVEAYGSGMPLEQVAQIAVQPPRGLIVTSHDPNLVHAIERAITDSDLGARPQVDGMRIRIEIPTPTDEQRVKLAKKAKEQAEEGRVAIRLARRDCINEMKWQKAAEQITQAKLNGRSKDLQKITDEKISDIDELLKNALESIKQ